MFESLGAMMMAMMLGAMAGTVDVACPNSLDQSATSMFSKNAVIKEAEKFDIPVDEMLDVYYKAKEEAKVQAEETMPADMTCEKYWEKFTEGLDELDNQIEIKKVKDAKEKEERIKRNEEIRKKNEEAKKEYENAMQDVLKDLANQLEDLD